MATFRLNLTPVITCYIVVHTLHADILLSLEFNTRHSDKSQELIMDIDLAPKYNVSCYLMRKPLYPVSSRPVRSADRLDLLVPRIRTAVAQHCAFGPLGVFDLRQTIWCKILVEILR